MDDELRDDYSFDYSQAKPNRFAAKMVFRPERPAPTAQA
jgi:hypothetical protein